MFEHDIHISLYILEYSLLSFQCLWYWPPLRVRIWWYGDLSVSWQTEWQNVMCTALHSARFFGSSLCIILTSHRCNTTANILQKLGKANSSILWFVLMKGVCFKYRVPLNPLIYNHIHWPSLLFDHLLWHPSVPFSDTPNILTSYWRFCISHCSALHPHYSWYIPPAIPAVVPWSRESRRGAAGETTNFFGSQLLFWGEICLDDGTPGGVHCFINVSDWFQL